MRLSAFSIAIAVVVATTATGSAQSPREKDLEKPLVIAKQGSFFVGGEKKALPAPPQGGRSNLLQLQIFKKDPKQRLNHPHPRS